MSDLMPEAKIIQRLQGMKLRYITAKTGISYPTLSRAKAGNINSLRVWRKLSDFFMSEDEG